MPVNEEPVGTCNELAAGDFIVARNKGSLVHRGRVTETAPELGLFWIMDELTGSRRLLDMADLEIGHVSNAGIEWSGARTLNLAPAAGPGQMVFIGNVL
jgi:hypothetical protein